MKLKILVLTAIGAAALVTAPTAAASPRARFVDCESLEVPKGFYDRYHGKRAAEEVKTRSCAWAWIPVGDEPQISRRLERCSRRHEDEAEGAKLARRCLEVALPPGTPVHAYRPGHAKTEERGTGATASVRGAGLDM